LNKVILNVEELKDLIVSNTTVIEIFYPKTHLQDLATRLITKKQMNENRRKCPECEQEPDVWDAKTTKENAGDVSLDSDGDIWPSWSEKDAQNNTFLFCDNCKTLSVEHKCGSLLICIGHSGEASDGTIETREPKTKITKGARPAFDIRDLGQTKLRVDEWAAAGLSYDKPHFWYCSDCNEEFSFKP
jgi:hypothetical protein